MKKRTKRILLVLIFILLIPIIFIGGYVAYMSVQYYRIPDNTIIETRNQQTLKAVDKTYTVTTYNIGFGAYDHDFSFFMDSGEMKDGAKVQGQSARAQSEEIVLKNTNGAIDEALALESDFYFFQEVDRDATRSFHIDQLTMLDNAFLNHGSAYASAFHSAYLMYPFHEPHGSVESGLVTLSEYEIQENMRKQYPVDDSFITKFTDLDRCFMMTRIALENGKQLVLINTHMSAYDKGGTIREQQREVLNSVLAQEYAKGNYVIVGGDFNHDIANSTNTFKTEQKIPEWIFAFGNEDIDPNYHIVVADNALEVPTCRSSDIPYEKGINYSVIVDGFIVSNNVDATAQNIDHDFEFSDHNPVALTFTLK